MGIVSGSCTLRKYYCSKKDVDPLEGNFDGLLKGQAARDIETMADGKAVGWVAPTHLLDNAITLDKVLFSDWLCLVIRTDSRSVPANLLKAYVEIELDSRKRNGRQRITKAEKLEVTDMVRDKLLKKVLPRVSGVDVAWNLKKGEIWLASQSNAASDTFAQLLRTTFGLEAYSADIREMVDRVAPKIAAKYSDLLPADMVSEGKPKLVPDGKTAIPLPDEFIGREFLTWLLYSCDSQGGEFRLGDGTQIGVSFDDFIALSSGDADGEKLTLRQGTPSTSAEAMMALRTGRMVDKAKLIVADPEEEWGLILSALDLCVSSMKLPKGEERHPAARIRERCDSIARITRYLERLFVLFLELRVDEGAWEKERSAIAVWIRKSAAGL